MPKIKKPLNDKGIVTRKNRKGVIEYYARVVKVNLDGSKTQVMRKGKDKTDAKSHLLDLKLEYRTEKSNRGNDSNAESEKPEKFGEASDIYLKKKLCPAEYHGEGEKRRKISGLRHTASPKRSIEVLKSIFGNKKLSSITPQNLEDFKALRLKTLKANGEPRSFAAVNRELEFFRSCLNFAVREDWLKVNPFSKIKSLISKADEVERDRVLSFEEEARLLVACDADRIATYKRSGRFGNRETVSNLGKPKKYIKALIVVALDTGARRGELLKLTWNAVHFDENIIKISQTISKTAKPRSLPITRRMKELLLELWANRESDNSRVFGVERDVKKTWRSLVKSAKIDGLRFHDLRHTGITRMVRSGLPIALVMKVSGHTESSTFLRYVNLSSESMATFAESMTNYQAANAATQTTLVQTSEAVN